MTSSAFLVASEKPKVLVVDDERHIREIVADFVAMEGFDVVVADDGVTALAELRRAAFDVVLTDLKMPRLGGLELLDHINREFPRALTIIMTGFGTVETAILAMKRGAYDYVLKPFRADEIVQVIKRAVNQGALQAENLRLKETVSLYKVSEAISSSLSLDQVVETVAQSAIGELHADVSLVWLDDGAGGFAERDQRRASDAVTAQVLADDKAIRRRLDAERGFVEHGPINAALFQSSAEAVQSCVVIALVARERVFGWVAALSLNPSKRFDLGQRKLLSMFASRAAAAIDNARLYENLQATFSQTIQGLAKTIDKMDHYTSGHSERVARYACRLAKSLGFDESQIEVVRQAALMHDIGKVGCVMNLNKPNRLTTDEYDVFKRHPVNGRDILDPIRFLEPVVPGVLLHHERWDGRGYPFGLEGKSIPLIARIISVADAYDAMTSDRAYRRALPHELSVHEVSCCAGAQFDPDVASIFTDGIDDWLEEWRSLGIPTPD
jgi:response regulator RpfG family c-di-GMP phosphodiesterase